MKKILFSAFLSIILLIIFAPKNSFATNAVLSHCLTITGKFTAVSWVGGPMMVGCSGDNGRYCMGEVAYVRPNKNFSLTHCSCPPYANGCLVVGQKVQLVNDGPNNRPRARVIGNKVPATCSLIRNDKVCGVNGSAIVNDFKVACTTTTDTPTDTPTGTVTPTQCIGPQKVINVKITCPNCSNALGTGGVN